MPHDLMRLNTWLRQLLELHVHEVALLISETNHLIDDVRQLLCHADLEALHAPLDSAVGACVASAARLSIYLPIQTYLSGA